MNDQERRQVLSLTSDQIEEIASRAADNAIDRITQQVYQQVGRAVASYPDDVYQLSSKYLTD